MSWFYVEADGPNVVAIFPLFGDDADIGMTGILELVEFAIFINDVGDSTRLEISFALWKATNRWYLLREAPGLDGGSKSRNCSTGTQDERRETHCFKL